MSAPSGTTRPLVKESQVVSSEDDHLTCQLTGEAIFSNVGSHRSLDGKLSILLWPSHIKISLKTISERKMKYLSAIDGGGRGF